MDYSSLKVVQLKEKLKELGLPISGLKQDLLERLEKATSTDTSTTTTTEQEIPTSSVFYETHDNGGRPFCVEIIDNKDVIIYLNEPKKKKIPPLFKFNDCEEIFVGVSPKTKTTQMSGGWGPDFNGNAILLNVGGGEYVLIGINIFRFISRAKISHFFSPIGNNDVAYTSARDEKGNYYVFGEDIILLAQKNLDGLVEKYEAAAFYTYERTNSEMCKELPLKGKVLYDRL